MGHLVGFTVTLSGLKVDGEGEDGFSDTAIRSVRSSLDFLQQVFSFQRYRRTRRPSISYLQEHGLDLSISCQIKAISEWKLDLMAAKVFEHLTFDKGKTVKEVYKILSRCMAEEKTVRISRKAMDNMKSHHAKAVKELLDSSGIRYIYLPPYSPDLNPIEKLWSKVKALLRKFKARTLDALPNAIQNAFHSVTVSDCSGWFRFCGYAL